MDAVVEEWRDITEAPGYQVSSLGVVMGRRGKPLTQYINQFGYGTVTPYVGGKTLNRQVHRLVAQAFIPNPENLPLVNHKDGDRINNVAENLEWVTAKQNAERVVKPAIESARRSRKVVQIFPDGHSEIWGSIKEAAKEARVSAQMLTKYCRDQKGPWYFLEDYEEEPILEEWAWIDPNEGKETVLPHKRIEVSTLGRIRLASGQIITGRFKGNYLRYRRFGVHRLVALAFCDRGVGRDIVNHLDGNPSNNCAANLEWTTQRENSVHAHVSGLCRRNPVRRVTPRGVTIEYPSIQEASRRTHISAGDISWACKGKKKKAGGSQWSYLSFETILADEDTCSAPTRKAPLPADSTTTHPTDSDPCRTTTQNNAFPTNEALEALFAELGLGDL